MQRRPTKPIVRRTVVSVIGVVMISLGSAAPADPRGGSLSPEDRCAIAKLEATAREATCMAEAQIRGISHKLTDEQVDAQQVACQEATKQAFEIAEGEAGEGACPTIGDADVIGYALALATQTVTSCLASERPCDFRTEEDPGALGPAILRNNTPHPILGTAHYHEVPLFCRKFADDFIGAPPIQRRIEPGQSGRADSGVCLITGVMAFMQVDGAQIRCTEYRSSGTGYRTFQVVLRGNDCVVNRP